MIAVSKVSFSIEEDVLAGDRSDGVISNAGHWSLTISAWLTRCWSLRFPLRCCSVAVRGTTNRSTMVSDRLRQ